MSCKGTKNLEKSIFAKTFFVGTICLKDVRVYAHHGCLREEELVGSDYLVQLSVQADLEASCQSDNLDETVDYVALNSIIKEEMAIRAKLLETVAKRINDRVLREHALVTAVSVSVAKMNPPIGGDVHLVEVQLTTER
ncbi:MAG: dihydroneopterin aldolase [Gilvibacter sp.]